MGFDFSGKKVLVTGAGRGLGRAMAIAMANAGCKVYALDMAKEYLDVLTAQHPGIVSILQDLSDWDGTRKTLETLEVLDGLVNNAAIFLGPIAAVEHTEGDLKKYMETNLYPAINCIQVIGMKMIKAGRKGSIVNISSVVSQQANSNQLGYCVAKAGIDMVTKQFALELGQCGIRVNSVNPTFIPVTDMAHSVDEKNPVGELVAERTPMTRKPTPEDVANAVMYLLSDAAAMVTGTVNPVTEGFCVTLLSNSDFGYCVFVQGISTTVTYFPYKCLKYTA